ncbi:MAG: metal-sulfur cluster assembly factor [Crenarchaeota archaeon]|nr:metal-sulfur cluster assembly factor [Thermoproteota archaeon]
MSSCGASVDRVVEVLRRVYDPELGISVYDLGLVYEIRVEGSKIFVELGVTSPFCPLAHVLPVQVERELRREFPGCEVEVRLNLERVWSPERMTEEGRRRFRELFGYDPVEGRR